MKGILLTADEYLAYNYILRFFVSWKSVATCHQRLAS